MSAGSRWRTLLAAVSLLVIGAAAGVTLDRLHHRQEGIETQFARLRSDPVGMIESLVELRPEQRQRIARIIESRQSELDAVWSDTHERLLAILDSVISEITAELDADQAERFRQHVRELHGPRVIELRRH